MMIMNEVAADVDASVRADADDDDDEVGNNNDIAGINQHKWQKRKRIKQSNQNKTENVWKSKKEIMMEEAEVERAGKLG